MPAHPRLASRSTVALTLLGATVGASTAFAADTADSLDEVVILGRRVPSGSVEAGYRVSGVPVLGPWSNAKLEDIPYTVNVIPDALIESRVATSPTEVLRMLPSVNIFVPASRGFNNFDVRGFNNGRSVKIDGFEADGQSAYNMEEFDRIEVLTGASGFLYGAGNPGGIVNFVSKRPTAVSMANVTVGSAGGSSWFGRGDFSGPIDDGGRFGYRLNAVKQNGETSVDYQRIDRELVSAALDWKIATSTTLQLNASHWKYEQKGGISPFWLLPTGTTHSFVPDVDDDWAQKWTYSSSTADTGSAVLISSLTDALTLRVGARYSDFESDPFINNDLFVNANGTFYANGWGGAAAESRQKGAYGYLDYGFDTSAIHHKLTFGWKGSFSDGFIGKNGTVTGTNNVVQDFASPGQVVSPTFNGFFTSGLTKQSEQQLSHFSVGDDIRFSEQWSALVGMARARIVVEQFNTTTGVRTSTYDKEETTPSASLLYRPLPYLTTYVTYIEGLERGGTAGSTALNFGEVMAPQLSRQYEVGAKMNVSGALLTVALFNIDKAFEYLDPNDRLYKQDGRRRHQGAEVMVSGKVTDGLTLFGGVMAMDADIRRNASSPNLVGKVPNNTRENAAKLYAEYEVPGLTGLSLTGGVQWTGKGYADDADTDAMGSYAIYDFGARYGIDGRYPTTLRLNATNLTNKNYWTSSRYLGEPRSVAFSVEVGL